MFLKLSPKETSKNNKNMCLENILFSIFKKRILFLIFLIFKHVLLFFFLILKNSYKPYITLAYIQAF